ncbi:MAG: MFS transporter, partial [Anaerolineae bacterium]
MNTIKSYIENVRRFSPEARLYLMAQMIQGISWGVFRLFFNFYVLSLGYRRDFLGLLISLPSLTALVVALFAGYVSDLIGRKRAFMLGVLLSAVAQLLMLVFTTRTGLVLTGVLRGIGMSLFNVTAAPFLMEHSTESERTHLFSFSSGITTTSSFVGNFLGGFLPAIFAVRLGVDSTSSTAYAWSLGTASLLGFITLIPFSRLDLAIRKLAEDPGAPFKALWKHRGPMTRLLLPSLILSLGAGMLMPFMNIFFRFRYDLSDRAIG